MLGLAVPWTSLFLDCSRYLSQSWRALQGSDFLFFFLSPSGISMGKLKINETNQCLLAAAVSADASSSKTQAWYGAWELFTRQNGLLHTSFYNCSLPSLWLWVMLCFWMFMLPSYEWIHEIALLCSGKQPNKPELHEGTGGVYTCVESMWWATQGMVPFKGVLWWSWGQHRAWRGADSQPKLKKGHLNLQLNVGTQISALGCGLVRFEGKSIGRRRQAWLIWVLQGQSYLN